MLKQRVPLEYVELLRRLYKAKVGRIKLDQVSKEFTIDKRAKQGDPMSPNGFDSVLEDYFWAFKPKWKSSNFGIDFGQRRLTNLRFADDILLVAKALEESNVVIADVARAGVPHGLLMHLGKRKFSQT